MKIKLCLLLGLIFSIENNAFSKAIMEHKFPTKRSAIQSSTYSFKELEQTSYNVNLLEPAIKELQEKISKTPTNYTLVANLIDLYIKTNEHEKAFEELIFLNKLNNQNRLNEETKTTLNNIYKTRKSNIQYTNNKTLLYSNMAMLALVTGNKIDAKNYISKATATATNEEILSKALKQIYYKNEDINDALNECNKIINKIPNSTAARKIKAELLEQNNNIDLAIKEYSMIIGLEPSDKEIKYRLYKLLESKTNNGKEIISIMYSGRPIKTETAYYDLATILLENDEIDAAKYYAEYLVKNTSSKAQGYALLSEIYRKQGNLKESYNALNEVKSNINSSEEIKNYNIQKAKLSENPIEEIRSLMKQKLFEQALTILNTMDQNNLDVLIMSAISNFALKNSQEAFNLLNKAMSLYPDNEQVYISFASIYLNQSDFESAKKYLNEAKRITPTSRDVVELGKVISRKEAESFISQINTAYEMQNYVEAERLTDEAMQISKEVPMLNYFKGILLINKNQYEKSTAYLYKCIELQKNNYNAYYYLAIAFENIGETENAILNYKKYLEYLPEDAFDENEKKNDVISRIKKLQG